MPEKSGRYVYHRYIGFVSSEDGTYIYKLHELLDAYPDTEKALRLQNDRRFQEAVQLFTRTTLTGAEYLLRIVRACPQDGIARWYLFAAERYYNAPAGGGEIKTTTCSAWTEADPVHET